MTKLKSLISYIYSYSVDIYRYIKYSQLGNPRKNKLSMRAHILRISHALEKGLSMPEPRLGYGKTKSMELIEFINEYSSTYGVDQYVKIGVSSIRELNEFHIKTGHNDIVLEQKLNDLIIRFSLSESKLSGVKSVTRKEIVECLPKEPKEFFYSRYSVRQFDSEPVTKDDLYRAIDIANKTPSVCNRQSTRLHIYHSKKEVEKVLSFQDGNKGFGNESSAVIVVTSDISAFYKSGERNQGYVDGGLFAMSLVYAFHSIGLGTCMLNWSMGARSDRALRDSTGIPENEVIVVMIAIGHLKDYFDVTLSPRHELESITNYYG